MHPRQKMKTYEHYTSSPDGWNVSCTLRLEDDGRFSYSEGWTDYTNASLSGGAGGTWRRGDGVIFFRAESREGPMYFPWEAGRELMATVRDGALDFGRGWTLTPPPKPKPPAPPPKPRAEAAKPPAKPSVKPPAKPPVKPPAPSASRARFEPRAPSPELAALLRRWVDELATGGPLNRLHRLCMENDAILLDGNQLDLWALRTDGQVLCIDHESFAGRAEPEGDAEVAYGMIEVGARKHPELLELLPPDRVRPS